LILLPANGRVSCGKRLANKGLVFRKRDIINDPTAMAELVDIGVLTTPVTVIDGEVIVGFDRRKLERALAD